MRIADAESGGDSGVRLERAIAIGVGEKEEIGGGGDEQPAAGGEDPLGKGEVFGHGGRRLEVAVAVGVVQADDAREGRRAGRWPRGIVAVFDDVRSAGLVERHRHRIDDGRFGSDQFDQIPRGHGRVAEHSLRRRRDPCRCSAVGLGRRRRLGPRRGWASDQRRRKCQQRDQQAQSPGSGRPRAWRAIVLNVRPCHPSSSRIGSPEGRIGIGRPPRSGTVSSGLMPRWR